MKAELPANSRSSYAHRLLKSDIDFQRPSDAVAVEERHRAAWPCPTRSEAIYNSTDTLMMQAAERAGGAEECGDLKRTRTLVINTRVIEAAWATTRLTRSPATSRDASTVITFSGLRSSPKNPRRQTARPSAKTISRSRTRILDPPPSDKGQEKTALDCILQHKNTEPLVAYASVKPRYPAH